MHQGLAMSSLGTSGNRLSNLRKPMPLTEGSVPCRACELDFDGRTIWCELLNQPNNVRGMRQGRRRRVPFERMSDWMHRVNDTAYGAWSGNALRRVMTQPNQPPPLSAAQIAPPSWTRAS